MTRAAKILSILFILFCAHLSSALNLSDDWRYAPNGNSIYDNGYVDQPYMLVLPDGRWFCAFTTAEGEEGSKGQHIVSMVSSDNGKTWSKPVQIEKPDSPSSSWATPFLTDYGRIYVFYDFNGSKMDSLNGKKIVRDDMLGWYCFRYSDDFGSTWSERHRLPVRITRCDRENDWKGEVQIFWGIDKPKRLSNGAVAFCFSKLGKYLQEKGEGWMFRCDNIQTERDPKKLDWKMLPEGDEGIRNPKFGSIQEEHNLVELSDGSLYCVYRTTLGHPACSYSRDGGKTWSEPDFVRYPDGRPLKTPRAFPKLYKAKNGKFLLWFHNHSQRGLINRNPVWISGGVEKNGKIEWSQPEILLHNPEDTTPETGRYSYPDFIENNGRYWVSETQKVKARVREIPAGFLEALWNQADSKAAASGGIFFEDKDIPKGGKTINAVRLPKLDKSSFTMEFVVSFDKLEKGDAIYRGMNPFGGGTELLVGGNSSIALTLSNYRINFTYLSDISSIAENKTHHIVLIVDAYARIVSCVIDGKLCDGGEYAYCGWARFDKTMTDVNCWAQNSEIGVSESLKVEAVRFYNRALTVSEAIGNFNALKSKGPL